MEEGPEPQEWVERASEEHYYGHDRGHAEAVGGHGVHTLPAITAAVLAVLAALGSLLSGHAANQAILATIRASDQWSYYQSKSTKGHVYEVGAEIIAALGQSPHDQDRPASRMAGGESAAIEHFRKETQRYEREKAEVEHEARAIEKESSEQFHKHHRFALAVAAFQVGIVLASVSLLVRLRGLYALSLVAGAAGLVGLVLGLAE
jgi:hypothetical protein